MNGSSIITTGEVRTLPDGTRSLEIVTDGRVGAQDDALAAALVAFNGEAYLSFRKSEWRELRFYYTDRQA